MTRPQQSHPQPVTPQPRRPTSRRDVLRTAGLVTISGGAVLTLAACGAEGEAGAPVSTSAAPTSSAPSASSVAPTTASPSASASSKAAPSSKAPVPDGPSVSTSDVPVGGGVILDGDDYVITQPSKGTYKAFSSICTHQRCKVSDVSDGEIMCRCHGSAFSAKDGSVISPPASRPLEESKTTVQGGKVYVTG